MISSFEKCTNNPYKHSPKSECGGVVLLFKLVSMIFLSTLELKENKDIIRLIM